jgi:P2 family phage major capsid protein
MRNETSKKFSQFLERVATLSGVNEATSSFTVDPSVQQTMEKKIQESSAFLSEINVQSVDEAKGTRLGLGVSGPIAKRTDTEKNDRVTSDVTTLEGDVYECISTEFDTHLKWEKLDAWAHRKEFQKLVAQALTQQQALDRVMIGFNGVTAATETDIQANTHLQDVNKGWLQKYRDHSPQRVLSEGKVAGVIRVGPGGDYANIDALIFDAVNAMIDPWHRENDQLKAIAARDLIADKYFAAMSQHAGTPTEVVAMQQDMQRSSVRFGGIGAARVANMQANAIFITMPEMLSIYWQRGSRRRFIINNPKRNRVEDYQTSNEAYVVEDFGAGCVIENIELGDWS